MDYKFWISIYAAVISTIVFFWRLYEFYLDRRGKLKIITSCVSQLPIYGGNNVGEFEDFLVVTITNFSKNKRQIEIPRFKGDIKINGKQHFNFLDLNTKENYPIALDPGDKHLYKVHYNVIKTDLKNHGITKIKAIVIDTYGKKYYSEWYKI